MVTNLPAEAKAKWIKVMEARTIEEKIRALEEFLSAVPKHKGTANLRLWATRRLAELREELEERKRKKTGRGPTFFIEKEGAAQIIVLGLPNSGKSLLVKRLTGARTIVADYPFSTRLPVPGMLRYEDIYFQLVDTPPLVPGSAYFNRIIGLARNSDALIIVLDATSDIIRDYNNIKNILNDRGILLEKPRGRVVIEKSRIGKTGIRVTLLGKLVDATPDDVRKLLESYHIYNAHVKIYGEVKLDDVEQAIFESVMYKPSIILVNKIDKAPEKLDDNISYLKKLAPEIPVIKCSALTGEGLDEIGRTIFSILGIIRIYTKQPNGRISDKPLTLREGATIYDVAQAIHKDFVERFQYARVWGPSARYPGMRVGLNHILKDGDIVEIRIKG